uniref:Glycine receptor, beta b n=1 Tax=Hucho hucho TaxID=62062 RepID=A0A4W5JZ78_9TELE
MFVLSVLSAGKFNFGIVNIMYGFVGVLYGNACGNEFPSLQDNAILSNLKQVKPVQFSSIGNERSSDCLFSISAILTFFSGILVEDKVNIFINSFGSIQETTMDYRVNIFLRQRWNDPRLKLPLDFKSDSLTVDPNMFKCLWKPDLFFANEKSANFHDVTQENILLFIFRNGDVLVSMRLSVTLSCPLDLTLFPMDTQHCKMQLESFGYTTDDLQFMWQSGDPVQMEEIYGNCTKFYAGTDRLLIWILSVLSLSSERMSLASELPKVSYVKAIDIWLIACLLFGFASLVEYAMVQVMLNSPKRIEAEKAKMASKAEGKEKAAGKNNTVNGTSGMPCHVSTLQVGETRCKKVCTSKSDLRTNDFSIVGSLPRDFELSNFDCYGKPITLPHGLSKSQGKAKKTPPPKPVIPSAAKRVDLYARALFPFSFLFFNVMYWSVYL